MALVYQWNYIARKSYKQSKKRIKNIHKTGTHTSWVHFGAASCWPSKGGLALCCSAHGCSCHSLSACINKPCTQKVLKTVWVFSVSRKACNCRISNRRTHRVHKNMWTTAHLKMTKIEKNAVFLQLSSPLGFFKRRVQHYVERNQTKKNNP